ncbi:hypothetical protein PT277_02280 [Acetobacteraceae bacterium ESL0709]|nr:hypothetical protein [Acetobacteraceae bacterium ESL0697]MDF7677530.1 hypothetical protein [Acetobacteraceae bacterium ESL0709]
MKRSFKQTSLAVLAGFGLSQVAMQAALADPDASVLAEAKPQFQKAFAKGGMKELSRQIIHCYDNAAKSLSDQTKDMQAFFNAAPHNHALEVCFLEDLTAITLEKTFRATAMTKGVKDPAPSSDYYAPLHSDARESLYMAAIFPKQEEFTAFTAHSYTLMTEGMKNLPTPPEAPKK